MAEQQPAVFETHLDHLALLHRGKVRDLYRVDDQRLLMITTDRISAFDVILPTPVAGKGAILTEIAKFWFNQTEHLIPNHLLDDQNLDAIIPDPEQRKQLTAHCMLVADVRPLPIEAVVRGYLIGSGFKDYQQTGQVCGIDLPAGLQMAEQLPEPIFTPATKAAVGDHDENISFAEVVTAIGKPLAEKVRSVSLALYQFAAELAAQRGIIIADTKFEFGLDAEDNLILIDEALTPDSSRFWPADQYQPGSSPPSFDKQYIRDWLETLNWDKTAPGPEIPESVVKATRERYQTALTRLTGN